MGYEEDHDLTIQISTDVKNIKSMLESVIADQKASDSRVSCIEGDNKAMNVRISNMDDSIKKWNILNTIGVVLAYVWTLIIK